MMIAPRAKPRGGVIMMSPRWGYCVCTPSEAEGTTSGAEGDTKNAPHFCEALNHFVMSLS